MNNRQFLPSTSRRVEGSWRESWGKRDFPRDLSLTNALRPPTNKYNIIYVDKMVKTVSFGRRWSCPEMASLAARALLNNCMNATRAAKELRPHLTEQSARKTGSRMMHTPAVRCELEKLMSDHTLGKRNSENFLDELWNWFLGEDKALKQTAARILGRGYLGEKLEARPPSPPFRIEGLDDAAIQRLTGREQ